MAESTSGSPTNPKLRKVVIAIAILGLAIAAMNAGAAREVWSAAREEHRAAGA